MALATWSVVIVSHNTRELTLRCVASAFASQGVQGVEVIVVDNASLDGSVKALRDAFPGLDVVSNGENVGFARAVNQGLARTTLNGVMLLNPDAYLGPDTIAQLDAVLTANPSLGAVGPWIVGKNGDVQHHCAAHQLTVRGQLTWHYRMAGAYGEPCLGASCGPHGARLTQRLSGAAMAFRRTLLAEIGGFDERFFMYFEDADFIDRVRSAGYLVACATDVHLVHEQGASSAQDTSRRLLVSVDAELAYFAKHATRAELRLLRLGIAGKALLRAASVDLAWTLRSRNGWRLRDDVAVIQRCLRSPT